MTRFIFIFFSFFLFMQDFVQIMMEQVYQVDKNMLTLFKKTVLRFNFSVAKDVINKQTLNFSSLIVVRIFYVTK